MARARNIGYFHHLSHVRETDRLVSFVLVGLMMSALTFSYVRPILGSQQYTVNAVWIQNAGWVAMNKNILTTNLTKVVNDLESGNITFAFVFAGYWDASSSTIGYAEPDSVWTSVINALHAVNIKVLAWVENNGTMNVSATNWSTLFSQIGTCMSKGFDGYNDDIENWYGTLQTWIDWENNCTLYVQSLGKIMTADVGYDWQQNTNPYLHMDYVVSMFYSSRSTLENPQAAAFWQEDFGEYSGHNTPPASPMIMGIMNYYGNTYTLEWQLTQIDNYLAAYGHPQLVGFCIWLYEYMGTNPDDWTQWNYWITRVGTASARGSICVQGTSSGLNVTFQAWIDNATPVQVPTTGYTFTNMTVGSHTVHAIFNGTTYDVAVNVADNLTTTAPFNFSEIAIAELPNNNLVLMVIGIAAICAVAYRASSRKRLNRHLQGALVCSADSIISLVTYRVW